VAQLLAYWHCTTGVLGSNLGIDRIFSEFSLKSFSNQTHLAVEGNFENESLGKETEDYNSHSRDQKPFPEYEAQQRITEQS
jgi:hypothetical protein